MGSIDLEFCHWNQGTFGWSCPRNWEDIVRRANMVIDICAMRPDVTEDDVINFSNDLYGTFCSTNAVAQLVGLWEPCEES